MKILHTPAPWNIAGLSLNDGEALIIESERHDHNTYYEECWLTAEEAAENDED
jgi:hypothetical protein